MSRPDRETRLLPVADLEARARSKGLPTIAGHAAVYGRSSAPIMGLFVEQFAAGAFDRAISEKQDVRALVNHDPAKILGRTKAGTLRLSSDRKGLAVEIDPPGATYAGDVVESIERGDVDQMSIAFRVKREEWVQGGGGDGFDLRIVRDVDLFDVSPVTFPAYEDTSVGVKRHAEWRTAQPAAVEEAPEAPAAPTPEAPKVDEPAKVDETPEAPTEDERPLAWFQQQQAEAENTDA